MSQVKKKKPIKKSISASDLLDQRYSSNFETNFLFTVKEIRDVIINISLNSESKQKGRKRTSSTNNPSKFLYHSKSSLQLNVAKSYTIWQIKVLLFTQAGELYEPSSTSLFLLPEKIELKVKPFSQI